MRAVVVAIGGLTDAPVAELGGKTPLEAAKTPVLDKMAGEGILGLTRLVAEDDEATTTATMLALLDHAAVGHEVAPAGAVAVGLGLAPGSGDAVALLDLVTVGPDDAGREVVTGLGTVYLGASERCQVLTAVARALEREGVAVQVGRQLIVQLASCTATPRSQPPWAALGRPFAAAAEPDAGRAAIESCVRTALAGAPAAVRARAGGQPVATDAWLWGGTRVPGALAPLPVSTGVLADEPAVTGVARLVGAEVEPSAAPEGEPWEWGASVARTLAAADRHVLTVLHVDVLDVLSHRGDVPGKVAMVEAIDGGLIGPIRDGLAAAGGDWRLAVLATHATSTATRAHLAEPVPFVVFAGRPQHRSGGSARRFGEGAARELGIFLPEGQGLLGRFLRR